ncbi:MAG: hypothetical protein WEC34_01770 [Acidimicrobiia bacterium]
MMRILVRVVVPGAVALALFVTPAVAGARDDTDTKTKSNVIVLNGQGNDLDAYTANAPFKHQTVYTNRNDDPDGFDINAQICFFPDGHRFIAGEDTGQPDPIQGWGIFDLRGTSVGKLEAKQIGKLQPTYQGATDNAENYGCGVLSDGRVVTTDIGNQSAGEGDGQLIVWFPPLTKGFKTLKNGTEGTVSYCKLDIAIATSGGIAVDDDDNLYVASARPPTAGVWKYSGPFPTSADASGGCGSEDGTGAPLADSVQKAQFIAAGDNSLVSPNAIVASGNDTWYVSSVFTGVINEYALDGSFVRTILQPPAGEGPGPEPISTGSPLGLGVAPDGTLFFADIGLVISEDGVGPGDGTGSVRRIAFVDGEPQAPVTMADGLAFPDGIGIYVPKKR